MFSCPTAPMDIKPRRHCLASPPSSFRLCLPSPRVMAWWYSQRHVPKPRVWRCSSSRLPDRGFSQTTDLMRPYCPDRCSSPASMLAMLVLPAAHLLLDRREIRRLSARRNIELRRDLSALIPIMVEILIDASGFPELCY